MKIGIIGGGILGLSLAHFLSKKDVSVTVFEGRDRPGGLLDFFQVDDTWIDKYYHCILPGDVDLLALVDELGLHERVRFKPTKQGIYYGGQLYPMASGKDFLLFPPLNVIERFRLALTIVSALLTNDLNAVEHISVEDWLIRLGGRGTFQKIWKPLLQAKFDDNYHLTPATYIWSRLKRTTSAKAAAGRADHMGYFVGSYKILVDRLVERIESVPGNSIHCDARVQRIVIDRDRVRGVEVDGEQIELDAIVATTPLPILAQLVPESHRARLNFPPVTQFLGVVCGVLLLDHSLSPYYTLNIADKHVPFTGIIETTNMIAAQDVGGYHLVYLPKYVARGSPYTKLSDDELRRLYIEHLGRMFPDFRESWIRYAFVFREGFVEPLHQIGSERPTVPFTTAFEGLYVVNNGQIYPELTNCQGSVRHAHNALATIMEYKVPVSAV